MPNISSPNRSTPLDAASPQRRLTLFDTTSIIVGIIIGSGIYKTAPMIAGCVPTPTALLAVWLAGGLFALVGSLCYAELATALPREGGDYAFLTRAYGRPVGFLFAWCELWVIRPGSIGGMAFVFADYAGELVDLGRHAPVFYAAVAVGVLTLVNIVGVTTGKWTQNVLTAAKVAGLLIVVAIGVSHVAPAPTVRAPSATPEPQSVGSPRNTADEQTQEEGPRPFKADWAFAMILILYAYGGWNDMAYVGAEVRDPERNILRALLLGTAIVTLIYLLLNIAFLRALGLDGTRQAKVVAADVTKLAWPWGAKAVSALVAISALGAMNGMIFTGGRIYYAMGAEHRLFSLLGCWSRRLGTPAWSLALQGAITLAVVLYFGLSAQGFGADAFEQGLDRGAFEKMVNFALPLFWAFLLLVGSSLIWLRRREPNIPRPFRVPLYPLTPLAFCAACGWMEWSSLRHALDKGTPEALWVLAAGVVVAVGNWAWGDPVNHEKPSQS
ncbi:MAG TPA: amino acid permease [Pirellulales bacterium]|nr:amino acid permease [Pirellulales bacterium]